MADEIINIASFSFDGSRLNQSLNELQEQMFALRKEQEANRKAYNDAQKEINQLVEVNKLLTNANQQTGQSYKDNEARIKELTKVQQDNFKAQQSTATQLNAVSREARQTSAAIQALTTSNREEVAASVAVNNALQREVNTRAEAKRSNQELNAIKDQLNPKIAEEAQLLDMLNAKVNENNQLLKETGSEREKQISNVGNYTESIIEASDAINPLNGGLLGFIQRAKEAGGAAPLITGTFAAVRAGLVGATQAGLAFLATPIGAAIGILAVAIGAVVGAFKFMTASMNSTEEGSQKLAKITGAISGIFQGLFKVLKPLGEFLGKVFIAYVETVGEALSKMVDGIAAALEFLGFDETAESLRGMKAEVEANAKAASDLAFAEIELDKAQRQARKTQLEYQKEAEKLRQARDDESKSISERIALNEQLGVVLQKQLNAELAIAQKALEVANLRIKAEGETSEALDAQAEALTNIADIEERIEGQRSEQLANLNSLRKEAADAEKERQQKAMEARQKAFDDAITKMEAELNLYIQQQGIRKKSMEEQLVFEQNVRDKELAILKKNLEAKKITQEQYNAEALTIQNEFATKQRDIAIENADLELELFKTNNQRKLDENAYFSSELYNQEIDRINRVSEAEAEAIKFRYEQGLLNAKEYELELLQLEQQTQAERDAAYKEREAAQKEKEAMDLALQREADQTNYDYDLATQMARYEEEYAIRKAAAEKAGADMTAFEQAEAAKRKEIEKQVQDNKLQLTSQTFGNLAAILGEESAAGKAAAVAQAVIDTYRAANAAYASLAGIPVVGPALGAVAAGAAIASGVANVKKITATKTANVEKPKYARGGVVEGGGTGTSDSVNAMLSRGETVINANSSAMFSDLLSSINVAGGGVPFTNNPILQNGIETGANNSQLAQVIGEAVMIGARAGTEAGTNKGIVDANWNNKIVQDAKF